MGTTAPPVRERPRSEPRELPSRFPRWLPDGLGILVVVAAAVAVLLPALIHGSAYGAYDLLARYGLTANPKVPVHNLTASDQLDELIPWSTLSWTQVHHGHLPLWNPYSALGLPLVFNWQAASFSIPSLIGYLFPLSLAYTAQVAVTLLVAGTGAYLFARLLRMDVIAAAFVGIVFELSGPMLAWLGWPVASVMSWTGWLFAAALLVIRARRRAWAVTFFAVALAASIYAGQPDTLAVLVLMVAVFAAVMLIMRTGRLGSGPIARPATDLCLGSAAGLGLAAPLAFPGFQLTFGSVRANTTSFRAFPFHDFVHYAFQSFDASATIGTSSVTTNYYPDTAAYVGPIVIVLAVLGAAMMWRRRVVVALLAVIAAGLVLNFFSPAASLLDRVHGLAAIEWHRSLTVMAFALAVLAGLGIQTLIHSYRKRIVQVWLRDGFIVMGLWVIWLWLVDRGRVPATLARVRTGSFIWPVISVVVGLVVADAMVVLLRKNRRNPSARGEFLLRRAGLLTAITLFVTEVAFLLALGAPPLPSSPHIFQESPNVSALQKAVGSSIVGFASGSCENLVVPQLGIVQETNDVYGVREFAAYDPLIPKAYEESWFNQTGTTAFIATSLFCPKVDSAQLARHYGVSYILQAHGQNAPTGAIFVKTIGDEDLYRVPGASVATVTPDTSSGFPSGQAPGTPVAVSHPSSSTLKVSLDDSTQSALRIRLTNVPGWHATIDGRPLALHSYSNVMLEARVPAGRHTVELHYWPDTFNAGIVVAVVTVAALVVALVLDALSRRTRPPEPVVVDVRGPGTGGAS